MNAFITWLGKRNVQDRKLRAVLRRSLAYNPGDYIPAYPYVEPFLAEEPDSWRRQVHYLVAGLWAMHWREGRTEPDIQLAEACARHQRRTESANTERRFINLLDADEDQLFHRLRQMVALLIEQPLDFQKLLNDLLYWHSGSMSVQHAWARNFYLSLNTQESLVSEEETIA